MRVGPLLEAPATWSTVAGFAFAPSELACVVVTGPLPAESSARAFLNRHEAAGGAVLALGEGFAACCAWGLLPGRLEPTDLGGELPRRCHVRVEGRPTPFTAGLPAGRVLDLSWGSRLSYRHTDLYGLEKAGQVIFRFCDAWAGLGDACNPVGAPAHVAGVCNARGNVVGLATALPDLEEAAPREGGADVTTCFASSFAGRLFASLALWAAHTNPTRSALASPRRRKPVAS
ncbi:MAG: phosphoribosylformylglycinamidine synthase I [Myxococcales bacterium]|nr:phosphoribosylformylglycinamidine synthase I [Myxococcales bacterium]